MKKIREYYICDRCFKEIEKPIIEYDYQYMYELCEKCSKDFKKYKDSRDYLETRFDEITKEYKFGKYLPKDDLESKGESNE